MGIPIGSVHSATTEGSARKEVICERCGMPYVYFAARSAQGQEFSPLWLNEDGAASAAEGQAHARLQKKLHKAVDLAPCPKCGHFQAFMIAAKRKKFLIVGTGLFAVPLFGILILSMGYAHNTSATMTPMQFIALAGGGWFFCVAFMVGMLIVVFDPNRGRLIPFSRKAVKDTLTFDELASIEQALAAEHAEAATRRADAQLAAKQADAEKQALAKARREEEMRKMAERARGVTKRPLT